MKRRASEREWNIKPNKRALSIVNPIRDIVDQIGKPVSDKTVIPLSQGDPSVFGNLPVSEIAVKAVVEATQSGRENGYGHSCGAPDCRAAVATTHTPPGGHVSPDHVFMTAGCSQACEYAIAALAQPGSNILLPTPGFPLYETIARYYELECRFYPLHADRGFEADPAEVSAMADDKTVAILICNPSNPTGANYTKEHLTQMVATAEALRVPIIADEVYDGMVFEGETFHPLSHISKRVPVLSVGAISKRFLVPGWRVGWLIAHDRGSLLADMGVLEAVRKLTQISLGPCSVIQAAVPRLLTEVPPEWTKAVMDELRTSAEVCMRRIEAIPGLEVASQPRGAMYLMVTLDPRAFRGISDDVEFARELLKEQSVVVLPGQCFKASNMFRICFAGPAKMMEEAFDRIQEFCAQRLTSKSPSPDIATPEHTAQPISLSAH